jgi:uncharacterized protein
MKRIWIIGLLVMLYGNVWALDVPPLTGPVNDGAGVLKPEQLQQLKTKLLAFEKATSNQIVILIVPSLAGRDDVSFGVEVFKAWKLGQKGKDNGVLWLHAIKERKNRLEVGYGLEGALPDATCKLILRQQVAPNFKAGAFYAGYNAGLDAIFAAVKGEYRPDKSDVPTTSGNEQGKDPRWLWLILVFIAAVIGCAFHPLAGGVAGGLGAGWVGFILYGPFGAVLFGFVGFLVGLVAKDIVESAGSSGRGGSSSYSGGGGSSGGGSSSYSGGGGSSGGGGASDTY